MEIEEQKMQGAAIKLLQILLEETCKENKKVIQTVCTNLKKDKVVKFIVEIFKIYEIVRLLLCYAKKVSYITGS